MRRAALLLVPALAFSTVGLTATAQADLVPITTTVLGARSILTVAIPALVPGVPTPVISTVTETAAAGDASWEVTMKLCAPDADNPLLADCDAAPVMANTLPSGGAIPGSALAVSGREVLQVAGGGASVAPSGSQVLSEPRRLFQNTGQDPASILPYTGLYTATADLTLTLPDNTSAGMYNGFLVVDLVQ